MSKDRPKCPVCGWGTLPILYGLPAADDIGRQDAVFGGCIVDDMNPDVACSNCNWTGQAWHASAPLESTVWVLLDPEGIAKPIGLAAGRFDEVQELMFLGYWQQIRYSGDYATWLASLGAQPDIFFAPFGSLSPAVIADLRVGNYRFEPAELLEAGFIQLEGMPPKFDFNGRMEKPGK